MSNFNGLARRHEHTFRTSSVFEGRKIGRTFSQSALFLAATAIHHGLTLVTRNIKDFTHTGAKAFNPWD